MNCFLWCCVQFIWCLVKPFLSLSFLLSLLYMFTSNGDKWQKQNIALIFCFFHGWIFRHRFVILKCCAIVLECVHFHRRPISNKKNTIDKWKKEKKTHVHLERPKMKAHNTTDSIWCAYSNTFPMSDLFFFISFCFVWYRLVVSKTWQFHGNTHSMLCSGAGQ